MSEYITPVMLTDSTGYAPEWMKNLWNSYLEYKISRVKTTQYITSNYLVGTISTGVFFTASASIFTVTGNVMLSIDGNGDYVAHGVGSGGFSKGGTPTSFLIGNNVMVTNAISLSDLEGIGYALGGSLGSFDPATLIGVGYGAEYVSNFAGDYWGFNFFGGAGLLNSCEVHAELTYTEGYGGSNIYDDIIDFLNSLKVT